MTILQILNTFWLNVFTLEQAFRDFQLKNYINIGNTELFVFNVKLAPVCLLSP